MASQSPFGVVPGHHIVRTGHGALLVNPGGIGFALQSGHCELNPNAHRHIVQRMKSFWYVLPEVFPLPDGAEDLAVDFHMDVPVWRGLYPGVQWPDPEES